MATLQCEDFQQTVSSYLLRHQSILDLLSKMNIASGCLNRAITKSVTSCGCLNVHAEKKPLPPDASLKDFRDFFPSHLDGQLCENCREIIINEMGKNLFYLAALCNTLDISLQEVIEHENNKVTTLGHFNMT